MLESALGYTHQAVVRVMLIWILNSERARRETFEPIRGGEGVARSTQETEKYRGGIAVPGVFRE